MDKKANIELNVKKIIFNQLNSNNFEYDDFRQIALDKEICTMGGDSLDVAEILIYVEELFSVRFKAQVYFEARTTSDIIKLVEAFK